MPKNFELAVQDLAHAHREDDDSIIQIFYFPDASGQVIRFIEVSTAPMPSEEDLVRVYRLGRRHDFPFPCEIALLSPDDWSKVEAGELALPEGWDRSSRREI